MKPKFYPKPIAGLIVLFILQICTISTAYSQSCSGLTATYSKTESRCIATGTFQINASGGSGTYNYKVEGTVSTAFTSSSLITGLPPGTYTITVKDIVSNCTFQINNAVITGSYSDPRFGLAETDVTCVNGNDGTISVTGLQNGRSPFTFTIVSPSPMGVGTSNATGIFTGLTPGQYAIQLMDSCGGLQTRNISVQNYNWSISSYSVAVSNCTIYHAVMNLTDSKGNTNASGSAFNGFQYGVVNSPGDTSWFSAYAFDFDLAQRRSVTLVVKDRCGYVQSRNWTNATIPAVSANVSISSKTCSGFTATLTGSNLTSPTFCLYDNATGNAVAGQPCNSTGVFTNVPYGSYYIKVTNTCYDTVITRYFSQARAVPSINGTVTISNYTCTSVNVLVKGSNLTNPNFCLYNSAGALVGLCNSTGVFSNVPYGSYSVKVTDGCTGDVFTVNFTASKRVRSVGPTPIVSGYTCTGFDVSITNPANLSSPTYCLVDNLGNPVPGVACNSTGVFNNLPYGSYCINITDACGDTTIQRCVNVSRPTPTGGGATISNKTCTGFTVTITGQANIFNGEYCLQDNAGNPVPGVACNSTGVFTDVPYGTYCIKTTDNCSGTVLAPVCFTVTPPVPGVAGPVNISNQTCSGFRATLTGQQNLTSPTYCLFNDQDIQIGACNNTGVFDVTGFGSYYIKTTDGCAGAVFTTPFSVAKSIPAVASTVDISNKTCTSFTATITGQANLTSPNYYLKNSTGTIIANNTTGVFNNIPYGSYCIDVIPSCLDTTIERCFTVNADPTVISVTATPSCTLNASDLAIQVTSGIAPYAVRIYDSLNNQVRSLTAVSNNILIAGLPALQTGQRYKVIVTSTCGTPGGLYIVAQGSGLTHNYTITPKCPSSSFQSGSGDLQIVATTNLASVTMSITQKNFSPVSINYSFNSGNTFLFSNLDAATYVITYHFSGCSTTVNDTVTIPVYQFPNLSRSAAYQCDNNSFSVGASVTGGVSPFTYQIIGSSPSMPSIATAPQASPVFGINNGMVYSLVRLRAIDACGNATLNDVSILPLANLIVTSTSSCLFQSATLSTDTIPNATYTWYKKTSATDSVIVGNNVSYSIPFMMPSDTGTYVSRVSVNSGCLTKLSYFHLKDQCNIILPDKLNLSGEALANGANQLRWVASAEQYTKTYIIERSYERTDAFEPIGTAGSRQLQVASSYIFMDNGPQKGTNFYRLKVVDVDGKAAYSNTIAIKTTGGNKISVYPNPVKDILNVDIGNFQNQRYRLMLFDAAGRMIYSGAPVNIQNGSLKYRRGPEIKPGFYFLQVNNVTTGESNAYKIVFE